MQIKKEFTHEQIVEKAKSVFLKNGYTKTSMRDIADKVGIGVSNIYNYFESKDELFRHIVTPLIKELERMMYEHHNENAHEQFMMYACGEYDGMIAEHVQAYMKLINNYRDELKLILYKSQGSSLETFIDEYTEKCTQQVLLFMEKFQSKYPEFSVPHSSFSYHVHIVWMFGFISEVIKHKLNSQEIRKAIEDYIQFEFTGWRAIMNQNNLQENENRKD
ncbi:MAG: TetR/AcrR family transcriptional regulator [Paludibacteraceae bacterium]|nr:TetR/AcrR family transcriptional regulator [Paludibacteraceae bacterium]